MGTSPKFFFTAWIVTLAMPVCSFSQCRGSIGTAAGIRHQGKPLERSLGRFV
jgi:hypothetical protein